MNGLDLFSGIGGLTLALSPWVRPVAYCERDHHAVSVLLSRMANGSLPVAPIWDDVQTLCGSMLPPVDIIYGGFPCQDISFAGRGGGLGGKRSGLFFEIVRLIDEIQPPFVFLENVPAIRTRGGERVGKELACRGYDCRWRVISAADVGAPHLRKRWFMLAAHPDRIAKRFESWRVGESYGQNPTFIGHDGADQWLADIANAEAMHRQTFVGVESNGNDERVETLADTDGIGRSEGFAGPEVRQRRSNAIEPRSCLESGWWFSEPSVGRVAHGVPHRVDRLRGLGNAVVPRQARKAFKTLAGLK